MQITVKNRQSLLDIALQECGGLEAALAISIRDDAPLTRELMPGQIIEVLDGDIISTQKSLNVVAATAISALDASLMPWGGIGLMGVEIDFIIS